MPGRLWTQAEAQYVRDFYPSFGSAFCAAQIDRAPYAIRMYAKSIGVVSASRVHWTAADEQFLQQNYPEHGPEFCSKYIGCGRDAARQRANELGFSFKRQKWQYRKHQFNQSFFSNNSEETAFVFGFWMADGCLTRDGLDFAQKDTRILDYIQVLLGSDYPYYLNKDNGVSHLKVCSVKVREDIKKLCLFDLSKKTSEARYPEDVDHRSFIRGYFEGDGCICYSRTSFSFSITGTPEFLWGLQKQLMSYCDLRQTKFSSPQGKNGLVVVLRYYGNRQVSRIMGWLYGDPPEDGIFLDGKYAKYQRLLG